MPENINNNLNNNTEQIEKEASAKIINIFSKKEIDNKLAKFNPAKVVGLFQGENLNNFKFGKENVERLDHAINIATYNFFNKNKTPGNFA